MTLSLPGSLSQLILHVGPLFLHFSDTTLNFKSLETKSTPYSLLYPLNPAQAWKMVRSDVSEGIGACSWTHGGHRQVLQPHQCQTVSPGLHQSALLLWYQLWQGVASTTILQMAIAITTIIKPQKTKCKTDNKEYMENRSIPIRGLTQWREGKLVGLGSNDLSFSKANSTEQSSDSMRVHGEWQQRCQQYQQQQKPWGKWSLEERSDATKNETNFLTTDF